MYMPLSTSFSTHFYSSLCREISPAKSPPLDIDYTPEPLIGGKVSEPSKPKMRKKGIVWQQLGPPIDTQQEEDSSIKVHNGLMHDLVHSHHRNCSLQCSIAGC